MKVAIAVVDANDLADAPLRAPDLPSPQVHPTVQALFDGLSLQPDIECHVVYGRAAPGALEQRRQGSVIYTGVPYRRAPGMGGALLGRFFALRKYIRQLQPDLVHGQGTERESALVAAFSGFPSIVTLHGNFRELRKVYAARPFSYYWLAAHLETIALRRVDAIICISKYVEEITRGFKAEKFLIPDAVQEKFLAIERPARRPGRKRVGCMGIIDRRKNTRFILQACEKLWQKDIDFELHVYGTPGRGQDYFDSFIHALRPWVEKGLAVYNGFVRDPVAAVAGMDVMVSASLEESFGMNILESMSAGTPAVAPSIGGIRDILVDGETGLFYRSGDCADCSLQLERLLTDEKLWQSLSQAGRKRAGEKFAQEMVAARTVQAYQKIVTSQKGDSAL
jgi:glycosyltransferase involved in cell wall biosynthesis